MKPAQIIRTGLPPSTRLEVKTPYGQIEIGYCENGKRIYTLVTAPKDGNVCFSRCNMMLQDKKQQRILLLDKLSNK